MVQNSAFMRIRQTQGLQAASSHVRDYSGYAFFRNQCQEPSRPYPRAQNSSKKGGDVSKRLYPLWTQREDRRESFKKLTLGARRCILMFGALPLGNGIEGRIEHSTNSRSKQGAFEMKGTAGGIDFAKNIFRVHCCDARSRMAEASRSPVSRCECSWRSCHRAWWGYPRRIAAHTSGRVDHNQRCQPDRHLFVARTRFIGRD